MRSFSASVSPKEYQLKTTGYYGGNGDKNKSFNDSWNMRMEKRNMIFCCGHKAQITKLLLSDAMVMQACMISGVKIIIKCISSLDSI